MIDSDASKTEYFSPEFEKNGFSSYIYPIVFITPLLVRTILGKILTGERSYDSVIFNNIVKDPSVIAFGVGTFMVFIALINRPRGFLELFKFPLFCFVLYSALGVIFGIFSNHSILGIFIGYELIIYFLIAGLCIDSVLDNKIIGLNFLERFLYYFLSSLILIAIIDITLPVTKPFVLELSSGRKRFNGDLLPLVSIQWSMIASVNFIISIGYIFRRKKYNIIYFILSLLSLIILYLAGSRGAFIGVIGATIFFTYCMRKNMSSYLWLSVGFFIILGVGITLINMDSFLVIAKSKFRLANEKNLAHLGGRLEHWKRVYSVLIENPFRGYGIGIRKINSARFSGSMHNYFLEAWRGTGIVGALLFTFGLVITGKTLFAISIKIGDKYFSKAKNNYCYTIIVSASIMAYVIIHSIVESSIAGVNNFAFLAFLYCVIVSQVVKRDSYYINIK